jgi:thymidine phosphorylase
MDHTHHLRLKRLGIDARSEYIIFMREDCHVCRSEGFQSLTRVLVHLKEESIVATLNVITSDLLKHDEVSLTDSAFKALQAMEGDFLTVTHLEHLSSLRHVRSKIYGNRLNQQQFSEIIHDITKGNYSGVHTAAFVSSCAGKQLNKEEIIWLTQAMIAEGHRLTWNSTIVMDKHCVGGLPGNRTTPIVVAIIAEAGLTIPKTSSRAITSPAGTADTMEVMAPVKLELEKVKEVVEKEGGCIVWGGGVNLSPADDIIIRVERALDIDSEGQMIASMLSKKVAAGSTHVVIDIPVGETAKVRTHQEAKSLSNLFEEIGKAIGLHVKVMITDGSQPIGIGIGPALEAKDVLSVLKNEKDASEALKEKSLQLAAELLELSGKSIIGNGYSDCKIILESGRAFQKFKAICIAQGAFQEPGTASIVHPIFAESSGTVTKIDNRKLARIAKLAGAPDAPTAGIRFLAPLGKRIGVGDLLYEIHAESSGELNYALEYLKAEDHVITIE